MSDEEPKPQTKVPTWAWVVMVVLGVLAFSFWNGMQAQSQPDCDATNSCIDDYENGVPGE